MQRSLHFSLSPSVRLGSLLTVLFIFLKYISDAFEEQHAELQADRAKGADPEDPDEYRAVNIFWVPKEARWSVLQDKAKQPTIGKAVDNAMMAIERDNPALKGVLPKDYAHPRLDKQRLGQLIDLVGNIGLGPKHNGEKDVLGQVYMYFLREFAAAEGRKGGQFWTPECVVKLLVEMLAPYGGRVYDPCCGSGGMFVQSIKFVKAHRTGNGNDGKAKADVSIFGQESNHTTWRLVAMPGQLFYSTQIPVCLWFIARDKKNGRFRDRRGEVLFVDARKMGTLIDRVHRELTDGDILKIADTYHAWRGEEVYHSHLAKGKNGHLVKTRSGHLGKVTKRYEYEDVPGFCKAVTLDDIRHHSHILTPGRYVGAAEVEDDGEPPRPVKASTMARMPSRI